IVCICQDRPMLDDEQLSISIKLSPTQVDAVVRAAAQGRAPNISTLIADSLNAPSADRDETQAAASTRGAPARKPLAGGYLPSDTHERRVSRSLLRGLSLLAGFGSDGGERGIVELAADLGMSPSTAHRYALTLVELGLLERCPRTSKYRLPGFSG